ncbi:MAG: endonuclease III [Clostridia bacterium]|nr:endonuclease III [Clostridia bacterium]
MTEKQKKMRIIEDEIEKLYPDAICSLEAADAFQLLCATRLSAQCTDARVNIVTPELFAKFGTPEKMAKADITDVENIIMSCGLYHTKAKSLIEMANVICEKFNGQVPDNMKDLTSLPGIGRKTANLIMGDIYKQPCVVCDTHFIRIMNRLGMVATKDPNVMKRRATTVE